MSDHAESIAIIGMAGRFPGAADIDAFWNNLIAARESITFFRPDQLSSLVPPSQHMHPRYVPARGVLDDADRFDAAFFHISEREALLMDPQQRVFLELCWNAFEHAAVDPQRYEKNGKRIGVYAGVSNNGYRKLLDGRADLIASSGEFAAMLANEKDYVATRVAHRLGLTGPAISLYTACSTSLVAIAQAWYALMSWQCDVALAGGINIVVPQESGHVPVEGGMESSDGHCRPFDARADGTLFSSGGAAIVLKRLSDALADGDKIWGIVRGVGVNNDGADKASFTSPSVRGQADAIRLALASADVAADAIDYVEAHGTGTQLGDPIEVEALSRAFAPDRQSLETPASTPCWLGSVKGNFGHLVAASGVTGLIKTLLALQHETIPPTLHFQQANAEIDFSKTPFRVADRAIAWPRASRPRRAGISSFGVGGTNAHVIIEEAPVSAPKANAGLPQLLILSARDDAALERRCAQLHARLIAQPDLNLADVAWTLATGRRAMSVRACVVASSADDACAHLEKITVQTVVRRPRLIFAFPGQGAQHANMARGLLNAQPLFRAILERCCALASARLGEDLYALILPSADAQDAANRRLAETRFTQPALFAVEYALAKLWQSWGVDADAMIGHSVGEYVAACLAGVFSLEDAIDLVVARAAAMHAQPAGAMLAVHLPEAELRAHLPAGIEIAAINAPRLTVVAGASDAIDAFASELADGQIASSRLRVSHAFHSSLIENALPQFRRAFAGVQLHSPARPFYSCVSGELISATQATSVDYWCQQLRAPVRFVDAARHALSDAHTVILEVGPGQHLSGLLRAILSAPQQAIASLPAANASAQRDDAFLAGTLGKLWCAGIEPDWDAYFGAADRQRVALSGYPFAGPRYWIEPATASAAIAAAADSVADNLTTAIVDAVSTAVSTTRAAQPVSRPLRLRIELRELFESISGVAMDSTQDDQTFLESGMDSLALTQAMLEIERRYKLKLKFRRLMEDLDTVAKLGAWIDQNLLDLPTATNQARADVSAPDDRAVADLRERPFGAAARITTRRNLNLHDGQRRWLDAFVARYTARTGKSKAFTQQHRQLMADPRAVTGFNPLWKELVYPIVADRSLGARLWDIDGNEYIDLLNGFGANFLGYQPPYIAAALKQQIDAGFEIGPQHPLSAEVAQLLSEMTGLPRVAFCNTGSEAVMGAMRIARTVTGRSKIAIFTNSYHGIFDEVIVRGTRQLRSIAAAPGILANAVENVVVLDYGSDEALRILRQTAPELAAVMIEPIQGRNPSLQPREFVQALRTICDDAGCALIFDEVITGFRIAQGGAQEFYGVRADIATYGKIIGGGLPFAAIAGSAHWMDALDGGEWRFGDDSYPQAGVTYFAGTFVRHPLALAAAKAALVYLKSRGPALQREISLRTQTLIDRLNEAFITRAAPIHAAGFSSLWRLFIDADQACADLFYYALREHGLHVYAQFNCFLTDAHGAAEVDSIVSRVDAVVAELLDAGILTPRAAASPNVNASLSAASRSRGDDGNANAVRPTDAQLEKWLACQFGDAANIAFNESLQLTLYGDLDKAALEQSCAQVTQRHEAFASTFDADGERLRVGPRLSIVPAFVDLTGVGEQRDARLQAHCAAAVRRPFDLTVAPLLRLELIRLDRATHVLFIVAHHLIFDGWSAAVFLQEIASSYKSIVARTAPQLPPADSLLSFVTGEHARRAGRDAQAQVAHWLNVHAQAPAPLQLPGDRAGADTIDFSASTLQHNFSADTSQALYKLAKRVGVTLYGTLLAGFVTLLTRLSGQRDFVIGVPFAGQALAGAGNLLGDGVNTLPLRIAIGNSDTFDSLARRCQSQLLDAADNQDVTLYTLARAMSPQQRRDNAIVTDVIFNLNPRVPLLDFGRLQYALRDSAKVGSVWQLFFNLNETEKGITLGLHYSTDRFDAATIERWIGHYESLLLAAAGADAAITELPILSLVQARSLQADWRATEYSYDRSRAVMDVISDGARRFADRVAVASGNTTLSYAQLMARAQLVGRGLSARGLGRGDLVGICLPRGVDLLVATLGIWFSGAAYVPLDPQYPAARLLGMVAAARIGHVLALSAADVPAPVAAICELQLLGNMVAEVNASVLLPRVTGSDLAYVLFTSGSTGQPKGVCINHGNLHNFLLGMQDLLELDEQDVLCAVTTLSFDIAGLELYLPLLAGALVVIASDEQRRDPDQLFTLLAAARATVLQTTPSLLRALLAGERVRDLSGLRLLVGGEELAADLAERVVGRCRELWNLYGPTETTIWSTAARIQAGMAKLPLGKPIANTRVYVLDSNQALVAPGVSGEIWIAGDGVAVGYLHEAQQTEQRFKADPFVAGARMYRTGDLGNQRDGVLYFQGRVDQQIKLRGFRIEPGEIETVARSATGVRDAVAVALSLSADDKRLVLYVAAPDAPQELAAELRDQLQQRLPAYMVPQHIEILDALPQTANGKIDRKALPLPLLLQEQPRRIDADQPSTPMEQILLAIWRELLNVQSIGIHDNFFEMGGDSLLGVHLFHRIQSQFGVNLPLSTLFTAQTIADQARQFSAAGALSPKLKNDVHSMSSVSSDPWSLLVAIQPQGERPPLLCIHSMGGNVLNYMQLARALGKDQPVFGLQSLGLDGITRPLQTLQEMATRYRAEIRSRFPHGPYYLAGGSMGGMIAFELAQQLRAEGEEIALLAMFDTYGPDNRFFEIQHAGSLERLQFRWRDRLARARAMGAAGRWRMLAEAFHRRVQRVADRLQLRWHRWRGNALPHEVRYRELEEINLRAYYNYEPAPYDRTITLFRAADQPNLVAQSKTLGWDGIARGIVVIDLAGTHDSLIEQPELSNALREVLNRAQADQSAANPALRQTRGAVR